MVSRQVCSPFTVALDLHYKSILHYKSNTEKKYLCITLCHSNKDPFSITNSQEYFFLSYDLWAMCNTNNIFETCKVDWICIKTQAKSQFEHLPSEAACNRQFPSPLVARGNKLWQPVPKWVHQFNRPVKKNKIIKKKEMEISQICGYKQDTSFYGCIQKSHISI